MVSETVVKLFLTAVQYNWEKTDQVYVTFMGITIYGPSKLLILEVLVNNNVFVYYS